MSEPSWNIQVGNPSPYGRSDYVEVDLNALGVDAGYGEQELRLLRIGPDGERQEVAYQIDRILGDGICGGRKRVLTFLATDTPAGPDDHYRVPSQRFVLERGTPQNFLTGRHKALSWVGHYYENREGNEPHDAFNTTWTPGRPAYGVKLSNGALETYFSLVPHPRQHTAIDYTGSFTSVLLHAAAKATGAGEMLAPYRDAPEKRWGQILSVSFFPLPWELRSHLEVSLLKKRYELVWSNGGVMRATVTVRSEPFEVTFHGEGVVQPDRTTLVCRLYRVISLYPEKPFIGEDIFVLTETGKSIRFRPCYYSHACYPEGVESELKRFEHIPDYFVFWKRFAEQFRGIGFASDAHVRSLTIDGCEARWRLQLAHVQRCIHYFMFHGYPTQPGDRFHEIGHSAWYERVYKPMRAIPFDEFSVVRQFCHV